MARAVSPVQSGCKNPPSIEPAAPVIADALLVRYVAPLQDGDSAGQSNIFAVEPKMYTQGSSAVSSIFVPCMLPCACCPVYVVLGRFSVME